MENHKDNKKPAVISPADGPGTKRGQEKNAKLSRALKNNLQRRKQAANGTVKADA